MGRVTRKKGNGAAIVTQAVAAVHEVLNAPDNWLTPTEKQGLLASVIETIQPEGEGLRIHFTPSFALDQSVAYFTT